MQFRTLIKKSKLMQTNLSKQIQIINLNMIQGIGQCEIAHSLPMISHAKKKTINEVTKTELTQRFLMGVARERISGTFMHYSRKIGFKYPNVKKLMSKNRYLTQLRPSKQTKVNQQNEDIEIEQFDEAYITENNSSKNFVGKQSFVKFCKKEKSDKNRKMSSVENLSMVRKKSQRDFGLLVGKNMLMNSLKQKQNLLEFANSNRKFRRYNTETDIITLIPRSHKKAVSFTQISETTTKKHEDIMNNQIKKSLRNKSLIQSFLSKINDPQINSQIFSILFPSKQSQSKRQSPKVSPKSLKRIQFNLKSISKKPALKQKSERKTKRNEKIESSSIIFDKYITELPQIMQDLLTLCLNFFQIKLPDKFNHKQYKKILEQIKNSKTRAWEVLGFLFWDYGKDGMISQQDLFHQFQMINDSDATFSLKQTHSLDLIHKNKNALVQILYKINQYFSNDYRLSNYKKITQLISNQNQYLQSAIISLKNPTYSQTESLIKASPQINLSKSIIKLQKQDQQTISQMNSKTEQILDLFGHSNQREKKMTAYQRCHIAAEHNQHTRQIRALVEYSRMTIRARNQEMKKIINRKTENQCLMTQCGIQICYREYVCLGYGQSLKNIVLRVLGYEGDVS